MTKLLTSHFLAMVSCRGEDFSSKSARFGDTTTGVWHSLLLRSQVRHAAVHIAGQAGQPQRRASLHWAAEPRRHPGRWIPPLVPGLRPRHRGRRRSCAAAVHALQVRAGQIMLKTPPNSKRTAALISWLLERSFKHVMEPQNLSADLCLQRRASDQVPDSPKRRPKLSLNKVRFGAPRSAADGRQLASTFDMRQCVPPATLDNRDGVLTCTG